MSHVLRVSLPIITAGLLAGCAVGPTYEKPAPQAQTGAFYAPESTAPEAAQPLEWWEGFEDPMLEQLLKDLASQNWDIAAATARVNEARAMANAQRGAYLPQVNGGAAVSRKKMSENGLNRIPPGVPLGPTNTVYQGTVDASWEIDLFGRTGHVVDAANAQAIAAEYGRADLLNSLLAETANDYFRYRLLQAQLDVLDRNVELRRQTLELVKARREAGATTELAVARARQGLAELSAGRPALLAQQRSTLMALSVLTTLEPVDLKADLDAAKATGPDYSAYLGIGLPSELLERRPDVRQAERNLAAATAELGVRTADLYPRISITGSLGQESLDTGNLADAASRFWSIGPRLSLPLFHGGTLRSLKQAQEAKVEQAYAAYQKSILMALRDVEAATDRVYQARQTVDLRTDALESAQLAQDLADAQYREGTLPLDELLAVEAELNNAEEQQTTARYALAQEIVNLGKALGGGWQSSAIVAQNQ